VKELAQEGKIWMRRGKKKERRVNIMGAIKKLRGETEYGLPSIAPYKTAGDLQPGPED
jgi:hypothetical protein